MITIDGSQGEGGGQIVRTALALSAITQEAVTVTGIRSKRPEPGLKQQHLYGIKALQQYCGAVVEGAVLGSEKVEFVPGKPTLFKISVPIETAGAITLVLQSLILPSIVSPKPVKIEMTGGTDVNWAPQLDYVREVILPFLAPYVESIELSLVKRGYYPKGQGAALLIVKPKYTAETIAAAPPLNLAAQGTLMSIKGVSHASRDLLGARVAERQAESARQHLAGLDVPITIAAQYADTASTGSGITLWAVCSHEAEEKGYKQPTRIGADVLGKKDVSAESVGKQAAEQLKAELDSGAAVDRHAADHLVPLLAFVSGSIKTSEITNHTLTNMMTVEHFLGKRFSIDQGTRTITTLPA